MVVEWDLTKRICHCGHVEHEGVCGEPCNCAEFKGMQLTPCGAAWFYGMDSRPKKLSEY